LPRSSCRRPRSPGRHHIAFEKIRLSLALLRWATDWSEGTRGRRRDRWDTDSFAYYAVDGGKVTKVDLLALVSPTVKAKIAASVREPFVSGSAGS
jgi:hypothetical protein